MKRPWSFGIQWEMLAITAVLFILVAVFVDLRPQVDENFSFPRATRVFANPKNSSAIFPPSRN